MNVAVSRGGNHQPLIFHHGNSNCQSYILNAFRFESVGMHFDAVDCYERYVISDQPTVSNWSDLTTLCRARIWSSSYNILTVYLLQELAP